MASKVGRIAFSLGWETENKMIDEKVVKQMLEEVFSSVEDVEAQSAAVLQFLKDKGMANEKEMAPYLEQAKASSGVRWVAIRARVDYLLSSMIKNEEEEASAGATSKGPSKDAETDGSQDADSPKANDKNTNIDAPGDTQKNEAQANGQKKEPGEGQRSEHANKDHAA